MSAEPGSDPFVTVARTGDVPEAGGVPLRIGGRSIALFRVDGAFFALDDSCPHQGAPLFDGFVFEGSVMCRHHGWRFRLADGRWLSAKSGGVHAYPVRVVGDEIQVDLS